MALLKPPGALRVASLPVICCLWLLCTGGVASAQAGRTLTISKEYQIKAVFLLNFLQFAEWPENAFADKDAPIRIGVLGDDPFGPALDEAVAGETVRNRRVEVTRAAHWRDLRSCHLLFISRSESHRLREIFAELGTAPVLTVSEIDSFARRDGVIQFYLEGNKVRFELNPANAQQRGLKLSSQLLSVARLVPGSHGRSNN